MRRDTNLVAGFRIRNSEIHGIKVNQVCDKVSFDFSSICNSSSIVASGQSPVEAIARGVSQIRGDCGDDERFIMKIVAINMSTTNKSVSITHFDKKKLRRQI